MLMNTTTNYNKTTVLFMSLFSFILYGCHTMEGAGTDIKEVGKTLERSAESDKVNAPKCCSYCSRPIICN